MPEMVNPETHHEKSDVNVRALLWSVVFFIIFGGVTHLLLYMQFNYFRQMFRRTTNAPLTSIARPPDAAVPQAPRLQPFQSSNPPNTNTPVTDMDQMRAAEEQALHTAGWVDREKGIVRLPIETAKALAVQRLAASPHPASGHPLPLTRERGIEVPLPLAGEGPRSGGEGRAPGAKP